MKNLLVLSIWLLLFNPALACVKPPESLYVTIPELIKNSEDIIFAEVIRAESHSVENIFWLKPVEILKGSRKEIYSISISNALPGNTVPVGLHDKYYFWIHAIGGTGFDSDCIMRPNFRIGHSYLIFYSARPSLRSYEEIVGKDDKWLNFVKEFLNTDIEPTPILTDSEFIDQFTSVHVYKCPSKADDDRGRPKLLRSIRGKPPKVSPWPHLGTTQCGGTGQEFLYLHAGENLPELTVPVKDWIADFREVARGFQLISSNKLNLAPYLTSLYENTAE